jgi:hypothetical protein
VIAHEGNMPRFTSSVFMDKVPGALPDDMPGYTAAFASAGRQTMMCWDAMP